MAASEDGKSDAEESESELESLRAPKWREGFLKASRRHANEAQLRSNIRPEYFIYAPCVDDVDSVQKACLADSGAEHKELGCRLCGSQDHVRPHAGNCPAYSWITGRSKEQLRYLGYRTHARSSVRKERATWQEHLDKFDPNMRQIMLDMRDFANAIAWAQPYSSIGQTKAGNDLEAMFSPDAMIAAALITEEVLRDALPRHPTSGDAGSERQR